MVIEDYNELVFLGGVLRKIGFDLETVQSTSKYSEFMLSLNPQVLIISSSGKKVDLSLIQKDLKKRQRPPKTVLLVNPNQNIEDLPVIDVDVILSSPVKIDKLIDAIADQLGVDPAPYLTKFSKLSMTANHESAEDEGSNALKVMQEFGEALQIVKGGPQKEESISVTGKITQQPDKQKVSYSIAQNSDSQSLLSKPINQDGSSSNYVYGEIDPSNSELKKIIGEETANDDELSQVSATSNTGVTAETKINPSSISPEERQKRYAKMLEAVQLPKDAKFSREFVANQNKALRAQEIKTSLIDLEEERKRFVKKMFEKKV